MTPLCLRKSRRECVIVVMIRLSHTVFGGTLHRAHDAIVRAAAAQVACQRLFDFGFAWIRLCIQQRLGRHDHAVGAIAALRGLFIEEGFLQRMQFVERAYAFKRGNGFACQ